MSNLTIGPFRFYDRILLFFFFQAEDGIRYRDVTGVQTCALPISPFLKNYTMKYPNYNMKTATDRICELQRERDEVERHPHTYYRTNKIGQINAEIACIINYMERKARHGIK